MNYEEMYEDIYEIEQDGMLEDFIWWDTLNYTEMENV
jgi:hypothetical protein